MRRDGHDRLGELLRLPTLSRAGLRSEWQRLYRTEPPARISRELLISATARLRVYRTEIAPAARRPLRAIEKLVSGLASVPFALAAQFLDAGTDGGETIGGTRSRHASSRR